MALKNMTEIPRVAKTQAEIDSAEKHGAIDLSGKVLKPSTYPQIDSFAFSDFTNTNISGCIFEGNDFSHSVGLDKAIKNTKTMFNGCNFTNADLPEAKYMKDCVTRRYTAKEKADLLTAMEPIEEELIVG